MSIEYEQIKLKKSFSASKKIRQIIERDIDTIKAEKKLVLKWTIIAFLISITFMVLSLTVLPVFWVRTLNSIFAILYVLGLIIYFKLNKELKSKTENPKEPRAKTNKFRNRRNFNIVLLCLSVGLILLMTVGIILSAEFYWTALIIILPCIQVITASIYKIKMYQKLNRLKSKPEQDQTDLLNESILRKKLQKGRKIIGFIFLGLYLGLIVFLISLFEF